MMVVRPKARQAEQACEDGTLAGCICGWESKDGEQRQGQYCL